MYWQYCDISNTLRKGVSRKVGYLELSRFYVVKQKLSGDEVTEEEEEEEGEGGVEEEREERRRRSNGRKSSNL